MNERYSEEVKAILEAAQQQAVMNYHQELTTAHVLAALCGSDGFFKYLLQSLHIDENAFSKDAKALVQKIPGVKGRPSADDGYRLCQSNGYSGTK